LNDLPLYLGADPDGAGNPTRSFGGQIDEVRLLKTVRYTNEFVPAQRFEPDEDTVVLYHLDASVGPYVVDSASNGTTARLVGGAIVTTK
jgi:hypothetical protein